MRMPQLDCLSLRNRWFPVPGSCRSLLLRTSRSLGGPVLAMVAVTSTMSVARAERPADVMPWPVEFQLADGRLPITSEFSVAIAGHDDARLRRVVSRALRRWEQRTGLTFARTPEGGYVFSTGSSDASLVIECQASGPEIPELGEAESYALGVGAGRASLQAATELGVQHGLETLLQLLRGDAGGWYVPAVEVKDEPRFSWRGLMIDVCRHWQPMAVIKRNIDAMVVVKLNVLHLHLSEDQGFRFESKKYPKLPELGSDGHYFTQNELREIVAYAADRGIRVVPEFDVPGHATSWVVAYPELASAPGPYHIERHWGVFDPVLDPTNEKVYQLLDGLFGEVAAIFPDPYFHIGGDENNGVQWSANAHIQAFIKEHNLRDNAGLHAYFNQRLQKILEVHGKKLIGWDEILHPDLPKTAIIQSWRGPQGLADASKAGHAVILSNGYYIDLMQPAREHYLNDPIPADTTISGAEQARVLGGEATMWAEWVTPETIDSRIWPRTAAIAERLWSPRGVDDVGDMYRRLEHVGHRLSEAGALHESNRSFLIQRYVGDAATPDDVDAVTALIDHLEPVRGYRRGQEQPHTSQFTPLTGLADCAQADSPPARAFAAAVSEVVYGGKEAVRLKPWFANWDELAGRVKEAASRCGPRGPELLALADRLIESARIGRGALAHVAAPSQESGPDWLEAMRTRLDQAGSPVAAVMLPSVEALRELAAAASIHERREALSGEEWRAAVEGLMLPAKP